MLRLILYLLSFANVVANALILRVSYTSESSEVSAFQPILFSTKYSIFSSDSWVVRYSWGDSTSDTLSSITQDVSHVYAQSGFYNICVFATNRNLITLTSPQSDWLTLNDNAPSPSSNLEIFVGTRNNVCYNFLTWTSSSNEDSRGKFINIKTQQRSSANVELYAQVTPIGTNFNRSTENQIIDLTNQFIEMGEMPSFSFHPVNTNSIVNINGVFSSVVQTPFGIAWNAVISIPASPGLLSLQIKSSGSMNYLCSIGTTYFDVSTDSFVSDFGVSNFVPTNEIMQLAVKGLALSNFYHVQDASTGVIFFGKFNNVALLQGLALITESTYSSAGGNVLVDLKSSRGGICTLFAVSASNCNNLQIIDVLFTPSNFLVVTSNGLVMSNRKNQTANFNNVYIGTCSQNVGLISNIGDCNTNLDCPLGNTCSGAVNNFMKGGFTPLSSTLRFFDVEPLYLHYLNSFGISVVAYSEDVEHLSWVHYSLSYFVSPQDENLLSTLDFISVAHDLYLDNHIFLLGNKYNSTNTFSLVVPANNSTQTALYNCPKFYFPSSCVVNQMAYISKGLHLVSYGSSIWFSFDGGISFLEKASLLQGELVHQITVSYNGLAVAFLSSFGRILYSNGPMKNVVVLSPVSAPPTTALASSILGSLVFDNYGKLWNLNIPISPFTAGNTIPTNIIKREEILIDVAINSVNIQPPNDAPKLVLVPTAMQGEVIVYVRDISGQSNPSMIFSSSFWPSKSHEGMVLSLAEKSAIRINKVYSSMSEIYFQGTVISPLQSCSQAICPVILNNVSLKLNVDGSVNITLPNGVAYGWQVGDIGKSVLVNQGVILLTTFTSASVISGIVIQQPRAMDSLAGNWILVDLRCGAQTTMDISNITEENALLTPTNESNLYFLSFSSAISSVDSTTIGSTFFNLLNGSWGIVISLNSANNLTVSFSTVLTNSSLILPSGTFLIYRGNFYDNIVTFGLPHSSQAPLPISCPKIVVSDCVYEAFSDNTHNFDPTPDINVAPYDISAPYWDNTHISMDYNDAIMLNGYLKINFGLFNSPYTFDLSQIFSISIFNSAVITMLGNYISTTTSNSNLYVLRNKQDLNVTLSFLVSPSSNSGLSIPNNRSVVLLTPSLNSLKCKNNVQVIDINLLCPVSLKLQAVQNISDYDLLYGYPLNPSGSNLVQLLPTNYRPPSQLGAAWPTTSNIYNADPSQAFNEHMFSASNKLAQFKQCKGKANRAACNCTDAQRASPYVEDSDCNDRALRLFFGNIFYPNIVTYINNVAQPLLWNYTLSEINGRTDWCYSTMSTCSMLGSDSDSFVYNQNPMIYIEAIHNGTANVTDPMGIAFAGGGLYHFQATVVSGTTSCNNAGTQFKVFVNQAPFPSISVYTTFASTGIACGLGILIVYFIYNVNFQSLLSNGYQNIDDKED